MIARLAVLLLTLPAFVTGAESDWPMFHGNPSLTGVSESTLPNKLDLLWSFKTDGPILGSAALVGKRAYIGSSDGNLYALNLTDGSKVWEFKTENGIESSPCVFNGVVYVGSTDNHLYAVDAETGKERWKYKTDGEVKASPNIIDGKIIVGSYDNKLHCVDAATGKQVWIFETDNFVNGAAAVGDGKTTFGGCDAMLHVIDITNGTEVTKVEAGAYIAASAALADGVAYVGNYENEFIAVDLKAAKILWTFKSKRAFPFFASPAVTKDRVIVGGRNKMVHCLDRATGKEIWSFTTRGRVDSSPIVVRGEQLANPVPLPPVHRVIVGSDDGRVYMLSLEDGKEIWTYEIGSPVGGSPAVKDEMVVIGAQDGTLYAFGQK